MTRQQTLKLMGEMGALNKSKTECGNKAIDHSELLVDTFLNNDMKKDIK